MASLPISSKSLLIIDSQTETQFLEQSYDQLHPKGLLKAYRVTSNSAANTQVWMFRLTTFFTYMDPPFNVVSDCGLGLEVFTWLLMSSQIALLAWSILLQRLEAEQTFHCLPPAHLYTFHQKGERTLTMPVVNIVLRKAFAIDLV